jgi:AcrR family transcriptional regulator
VSSEPQSTRERILAAALNLLEDGTGNAIRMSDIAKAAHVSRQALYLHFKTRAELLIETTYYVDRIKGSEARLLPSRTAKTGEARLDAFVEAWGNYIPEIYGAAKAFMTLRETDAEAADAWSTRMQDMREGCAAAIEALARDGTLSPNLPPERATDLLWTLLSVRNWEQLTQTCGWSQKDYVEEMKATVRRLFVACGG